MDTETRKLPDLLAGLAVNPLLPDDLAVRLLAHGQAHNLTCRPGFAPSTALCGEFVASGRARELARVRLLPEAVAVRLARDPDPEVRAALAAHDRPDGDRHGLFSSDPDARVRRALAGNPLLKQDLLARLAADRDAGVRAAAAAAWTDPPADTLRALLIDPAVQVRAAACTRRPPRDLYGALLADPATRRRVVPFLELDRETATALAADQDEEVRDRLARHPQLPAEVRDRLARDPDAGVRAAVFERADTPPGLRAEIHEGLLAGYRRADAPLTAGTGEDEEDGDFLCYIAFVGLELAAYPWVTADPLPYADCPYVGMRRAAARSEALPVEARRRMHTDEDAIVRFLAFARTPDPDLDVAEDIERRHLRGKFSDRPADCVRFPPETLRRFGSDPDPHLRVLALRDPGLPQGLAERLAADEKAHVRRAVAGSGHPRLPEATLLRLLSDAEGHVAEAAASSPMLPEAAMRAVLDLADAAGGPSLPDDCDCDCDRDCDSD
ncbi:hypothetical protein [Streptomyces sp. NPDC059874]|uniref:hypothetical protein n=1 Tax=Streptomyces sp. NPDC059874 TaxID=3346983 RepID=UPI003661FCAC